MYFAGIVLITGEGLDKMKIGDLVKVKDCEPILPGDFNCECFFCSGKSNRVGVILGPAPRNSWHVMFDCGSWRLDNFDFANGDVKVINAA